MARLAKSLATLRKQVDDQFPDRSKKSDGWIGDKAHAARVSDHNPNKDGVVTALDLTHDPGSGFDAGKLAEALVASRDPRIKYLIWNKRICASYASGNTAAWTWRRYSGSNPHTRHIHISVRADATLYDDDQPWWVGGSERQIAPPAAPAPNRHLMASLILSYEARRDKQGRLAVYELPAGDGGGTYEVAGINDRYHPVQAAKLRALIFAGRHHEAEAAAIDYILDYTNIAQRWTDVPAVEFMLRNAVFNRGAKGAARILQRSVGVPDDGVIGPKTKAAMTAHTSSQLLDAIREGREDYERNGVGYRPKFWRGLVNRWNKERRDAEKFSLDRVGGAAGQPSAAPDVAGGGAAAVAAEGALTWFGVHPAVAILLAVSLGVAAFMLFRYWRRRNG